MIDEEKILALVVLVLSLTLVPFLFIRWVKARNAFWKARKAWEDKPK